MPCPTCDHTMQSFGVLVENGARIYWCPRCGTVKTDFGEDDKRNETDTPRLPFRVREFIRLTSDKKECRRAWTDGLYESCMINPEYPHSDSEAASHTQRTDAAI